MKPIAAIVGRPNVGKSTLFNNLTSSRDALVVDRPGITRDRQYGVVNHNLKSFLIIDTGGIGETDHDSKEIADLMLKQSMLAINESSVLIWIVDGRTGLTSVDEILAKKLRKFDKPIFIAVNKLEGNQSSILLNDFYKLGIDSIWPISAKRGDGINKFLDEITNQFSFNSENNIGGEENTTISFIGKPNVGKSTLINKIIGEKRVLTSSRPGTTRDSIKVTKKINGKDYIFFDTAGIRRKSKIKDTVEKFSILKSFEAIELANIVVLIIDGTQGITDQDSTLLGIVRDSGKSIIIAINKCDMLEKAEKERIKSELLRKFNFIDYAEYHYISAKNEIGIKYLIRKIDLIIKSLKIDFSTPRITDMLEVIISKHPPKIIQGRRIKLRYMHLVKTNPIRFIIHGNQTKNITDSYKRYLCKAFRKKLKLLATPVLIEFKQNENPYVKERKNRKRTR
tara:strand:+ start:827 stop:2182 length:1356 start_codon:yes stop_codon:yes gene_type:complete